ncbi:hypothetical protein CH63R_04617 [Colletotrichum higginsianum IMI 349063]|uniref:Uncharacterized protein n=1 Tax=Colletotrichum higginsianum (strain IMI 349063) TaxID=759273 RepID=A0A1B7YJR6_COLHI|nr:hypothetical protein CH63R_04617 [Colletotrichum higginsianum IMI 349063]OBR12321.1 hypothetical protein CH63R_04617 [Colletotrichum higginsianum IMI 349063]
MVWDTTAIRDGSESTELEAAAGGLRYQMSCMPGMPHTTRRERPVTPFGPGQGGYWDRRAGWEPHTYAQGGRQL